jgi:pimeloyl-ACP methyl ester carboxylesterase
MAQVDLASPDVRRLKLWQDRIETEVEVSGKGPPLVWLHGPWGLNSDRPFIERLSSNHTVYAPRFPGTTRGDPDGVHALVGWLDLAVYHGELFDKLALASPIVMGHSFGALLAAEIAAAAPKSVGRLVLIDPVGLWRDDMPVKNWMVLSDKARRSALFAEPDGEAAKHFFHIPSDPEARLDTLSQMVWSQACTGKFVWPIADRGFSARAHRIATPTLIVWGDADGIIAPAYAGEFAKRIAGARVAMIQKAGHLPHLEQSDAVTQAVRGFLAG